MNTDLPKIYGLNAHSHEIVNVLVLLQFAYSTLSIQKYKELSTTRRSLLVVYLSRLWCTLSDIVESEAVSYITEALSLNSWGQTMKAWCKCWETRWLQRRLTGRFPSR